MGGDSVSGHEKMPQTFSISAALARKQKWTVSCRHRPFSVLLFPCLRPPCGGRPVPSSRQHPSILFRSTPPVRGATPPGHPIHLPPLGISIHAPRAGGDQQVTNLQTQLDDFNPRPPCGGRLRQCWVEREMQEFQSTPPVRGATRNGAPAPGAGPHFNPRPPCGGRLTSICWPCCASRISIHAPRAGGDPPPRFEWRSGWRFQSTPPVRGATLPSSVRVNSISYFNPRPPCGGRPQLLSGL